MNGINKQGSGSYELLCETPRKCVQLCEAIEEDQGLTVPCSMKRGKNHRGRDALYKVEHSQGKESNEVVKLDRALTAWDRILTLSHTSWCLGRIVPLSLSVSSSEKCGKINEAYLTGGRWEFHEAWCGALLALGIPWMKCSFY